MSIQPTPQVSPYPVIDPIAQPKAEVALQPTGDANLIRAVPPQPAPQQIVIHNQAAPQPMMMQQPAAMPMIVQTAPAPTPIVTYRSERYCGPISWLVGIFIFPCICCCPFDERQVPVTTYAPAQQTSVMVAAPPPNAYYPAPYPGQPVMPGAYGAAPYAGVPPPYPGAVPYHGQAVASVQ